MMLFYCLKSECIYVYKYSNNFLMYYHSLFYYIKEFGISIVFGKTSTFLTVGNSQNAADCKRET